MLINQSDFESVHKTHFANTQMHFNLVQYFVLLIVFHIMIMLRHYAQYEYT